MDLTRIFLSWANVVLSRSRWWTTPLHQTADEDLAVTQDEVQRDELSGDSLVPRRGAHQAGCEVPSRRVGDGPFVLLGRRAHAGRVSSLGRQQGQDDDKRGQPPAGDATSFFMIPSRGMTLLSEPRVGSTCVSPYKPRPMPGVTSLGEGSRRAGRGSCVADRVRDGARHAPRSSSFRARRSCARRRVRRRRCMPRPAPPVREAGRSGVEQRRRQRYPSRGPPRSLPRSRRPRPDRWPCECDVARDSESHPAKSLRSPEKSAILRAAVSHAAPATSSGSDAGSR